MRVLFVLYKRCGSSVAQKFIKCNFPPSSCVSPIPFPLCAMLEGTHGTAPQGATRRDWRKAQQSLFRRFAPYGIG